jgi:hypothetical protein
MSTNYLFFSKQCQHSIRLISTINKSNLGAIMNLCNIDDPQIQIPPFITSVPTLYLGNEKKALTGQDLFTWINTQINSSSNKSVLQNQEVTGDDNISAFQQNELGANYSDSYSFIESNDNSTALNHSFSFLGNENKIPEYTKSGDISGGNGSSDGGSGNKGSRSGQKQDAMNQAYEQLTKQRDNEVPKPLSAGRI